MDRPYLLIEIIVMNLSIIKIIQISSYLVIQLFQHLFQHLLFIVSEKHIMRSDVGLSREVIQLVDLDLLPTANS